MFPNNSSEIKVNETAREYFLHKEEGTVERVSNKTVNITTSAQEGISKNVTVTVTFNNKRKKQITKPPRLCFHFALTMDIVAIFRGNNWNTFLLGRKICTKGNCAYASAHFLKPNFKPEFI